MGFLVGLGECALAVGDNPGHCAWCGRPLRGRQRRWCERHRDTWGINHYWADARLAALIRDGHRCVDCGSDGELPAEMRWWHHFLRTLCPPDLPGQFQWVDEHALVDAVLLDRRLEVDHVEPCLGKHAVPGCWHHLDKVSDEYRLLVAEKIGGGRNKALGVVVKEAEPAVARAAEKGPDSPGGMVVIYVRDDFREALTADGARVPLLGEHPAVVARLQAIVASEHRGLAGAAPSAIEGIGPHAGALDAAEETRWRCPIPGVVPSLAPFSAIPAQSVVQWSEALEAAVSTLRPVEAAVSTPAGVVLDAQSGGDVTGGALATGHAAWDVGVIPHVLAVCRVPATRMPKAAPGLRTLCHRCHLVRTAEQFGREPPTEQLTLGT